MSRILIYGDIGGHYDKLLLSLKEYGISITPLGVNIPDDTYVIQVGDLIDRGPKSNELVYAVNNTIYEKDCHWIQLLGNHEANWIGPNPQFTGFDHYITKSNGDKIKAWFFDKVAKMAVGVSTEEGDFLVTHAGLTYNKWCSINEAGIIEAIDALNKEDYAHAFMPGIALTDYFNEPVGVAWAETTIELLLPWIANHDQIPFHQVHGHSTSFDWPRGQHSFSMPRIIKMAEECKANIDFTNDLKDRMYAPSIDGWKFWEVDQCLGKYPSFDVKPLVLEGEIIQ